MKKIIYPFSAFVSGLIKAFQVILNPSTNKHRLYFSVAVIGNFILLLYLAFGYFRGLA